VNDTNKDDTGKDNTGKDNTGKSAPQAGQDGLEISAEILADSLEPPNSRRTFITWLWRLPVIAAAAGGVWGFLEAYRVHFSKPAPAAEPVYRAFAPVIIGDLAAFGEPWQTREFTYAGLPAIAVRLPAPAPGSVNLNGQHFLAVSRLCTHQGCLVSYKSDPETIAFAYNFRTDSPALACNCHLSVFSLVNGGRAMSGPARFPLPRVRLEGDANGNLLATGLEQPPTEDAS
jgi:arsenite oxidase small subunit